MSATTKILMDEHKNILKLIEALDKEAGFLESGKQINKEFFIKAIDFIRSYADKFHHAKEEDILFKEFTKAAEEGCVHCNPVEQMLHEHDLGRGFVKGVEEALKENNKTKLAENAKGYVNLLKEHIFKEDNILYPMAERALGKQEENMIKKFMEVEKEKKEDKEKAIKFVKSLK